MKFQVNHIKTKWNEWNEYVLPLEDGAHELVVMGSLGNWKCSIRKTLVPDIHIHLKICRTLDEAKQWVVSLYEIKPCGKNPAG